MASLHGPKDYLDMARSAEATPEQLRELARSPYDFVIHAVALHPSTPADVLAALVPSDLRMWNDGAILDAIVRNRNTPESALRKIPGLVLSRLWDCNSQIVFGAGVALTKRDDTPEEVLVALVADARATTEYRKVVARETTRPSLREQLRSDRSEKVRRAAALPPNDR
jgi:hypothetical protein